MTAADLFVRCLENEGVKYVFGLPGEENLDILEALRKSNIQFVVTRHEQGAAFMADVYGRLTGRAGVCLATLGPGATNLFTGVADANMDRAPLVAITGQADMRREHKESHQYIDVVNAFKPITKWNARVSHEDTIPEIVRKAFRLAEIEKRGATHIEISEAIAGRDLTPDIEKRAQLLKAGPAPMIQASRKTYKKAVELIKNGKCVILLAGNGIIRGNASRALVKFCEKNKISVANTFMAKGAISARHDLFIATIGLQAKDFVMCGFDQADLIITVGYDLMEYSPKFWNAPGKHIIHIDSQPAEIDKHYEPEIELVGDIATTLEELTELTGFDKSFAYLEKLKKIAKEEYRQKKDSVSFPVKPQKILYDLRHALSDEDIVISDVGMHKLWVARLYPAYEPNTVIISNGFASMGISLPGALAAKLVHPDRNVVAVCGDGSFLMNSQELETAKRLGLAFVVIIFNDGKYGMIEWKQVNQFGKPFGMSFGNPDFVKYAESFGCIGMRVKKTKELLPMLKEAVKIKNVVIVDVPVDYTENFELSNRLGKLVCPL
ncbi:acetolactate synthase large subunit [Candidatus Peregrinibacteria bacterium]|nr:acetolactate synthase large subunit [Candidatus Peregrinibacteria bacterium]